MKKPRRDNAYEAMKIIGDSSIPVEEAVTRVRRLIRRMKPANQVFIIGMGLWFREQAAQRKEPA